MNKMNFVLMSALLMPALSIAEEVPAAVHELAPALKAWGNDPVLVQAVKGQNAKAMSLDEIKAKDKTWIATDGVDAFMKSLLESDTTKHLLTLESSKPYFTEVFVMDNQGANVAMTNKTSDYWQGDESKFTGSYAGGKGEVHIGKVKFDESAQTYLVQVSVPVMDAGNAIGAITIGVNLDELEKAK